LASSPDRLARCLRNGSISVSCPLSSNSSIRSRAVSLPYLHYGWIPAKHLKSGMRLKTPDGQSAVVAGGSTPADHDRWMWDLTVPGNNDHDFYVAVAATAVLVHNCPAGPKSSEDFQ
jgi:hypothetical protein